MSQLYDVLGKQDFDVYELVRQWPSLQFRNARNAPRLTNSWTFHDLK